MIGKFYVSGKKKGQPRPPRKTRQQGQREQYEKRVASGKVLLKTGRRRGASIMTTYVPPEVEAMKLDLCARFLKFGTFDSETLERLQTFAISKRKVQTDGRGKYNRSAVRVSAQSTAGPNGQGRTNEHNDSRGDDVRIDVQTARL